MSAQALVRRLAPGDWQAYRALRLRALEGAPEAFGATLDEALARPLEDWAARLAQASVSGIDCPLVAEAPGRPGTLAGLLWARVDDDDPGTVNLYQMWVAPEWRGQGMAAGLLAAALGWARDRGARTVGLGVNCANAAALALYRRAGFSILGEAYPMPGTPGRMEFAMRLALDAPGRGNRPGQPAGGGQA
ncbi:GNAT family N-acetyltransferase [Massilia oculi]|uniref:GNAT family N-acetyltransferase n=1 Tax=Massilia hydrophila TaxID=3044279 RepID=A0ABS7YB92_9BURK|nr:GNAT family N-acetyltransferase [Massilia oculi]MCA1856958.1 GNAT family N-acetyltransferase [Massilia oculi]